MRSLSRSKKGQISGLTPAILTLVFAATLLIFGLVVLQELRDVETLSDSAGTVANETGASLTSSGYTVGTAGQPGFNSLVITGAWNGSQVVATPNFTVSGAVVTNSTAINYATLNIAYTYNFGEDVYASANETLVGLGTFSDFWEIMVLAVVISIVIGTLLIVFARSGQR